MSLLQNQSVEIVVDAHAAPYMLHDGNHEVTVELDSQSSRVMVNVTNCRTGDTFHNSWDAAGCASALPGNAPESLSQPHNFYRLVFAMLQYEASKASVPSCSIIFGSGTTLVASSREEADRFVMTGQLDTGEGLLQASYRIELAVRLAVRAPPERRHELENQRLRQAMATQGQTQEKQVHDLNSQHNRTVVTLAGGLILAAIAVATVILQNDGSASPQVPHECVMINLLHVLSQKVATVEQTVTTRLIEVLATVLGVLLLLNGWRLVEALLFFAGFLSSAALCFTFTWALSMHLDWFSCTVLSLATILGGLMGGLLTRSGTTAAFALLGALTGAVLGYFTYILALGRFIKGPVMFWLVVLIPAMIGGVQVVRRQREAAAVTSSIIGSFIVVVSMTLMFLPKDATNWLALRHGILHPDIEPVADWFHVLGPAIVIALLATRGTLSQLQAQEQHQNKGEDGETAPLMGLSGQSYGACAQDANGAAVVAAVRVGPLVPPAQASAPYPEV